MHLVPDQHHQATRPEYRVVDRQALLRTDHLRQDIDKATPRIARALVTNEEITEAEFRFFDSINGTETLVYTVTTQKGTITSQRQFVSDTIDPALATRPPEEEVGLVFQSITGTWADGNIAWADNWGATT